MTEEFWGKVTISAVEGGAPTIVLQGAGADMLLGPNGSIALTNKQGNVIALLAFEMVKPSPSKKGEKTAIPPAGGQLELRDGAGEERIRLSAGVGSGYIRLRDSAGHDVFRVDGKSAALYVGAAGNEGEIRVRDNAGHDVFQVNGKSAALYVGAAGNEGEIRVRDNAGHDVFHMDGQSAVLHLKDRITLGGADGTVRFSGVHEGFVVERIHVNPSGGNIWAGGNGEDGDVVLFPAGAPHGEDPGVATVHASAGDAHLRIGGNGIAGSMGIFAAAPNGIKGKNFSGSSIWLDGETGDIRLTAADCAEDFEVRDNGDVEPGSVLVLGQDGILDACNEAYDRRVAGIVAGAGDFRPGIVFDRRPTPKHRLPIALLGKTFCKIDARYAPIEIGDLLTTSPTRAHAMRADDPARAFGAVLGKALGGLKAGQGVIPILVALQ